MSIVQFRQSFFQFSNPRKLYIFGNSTSFPDSYRLITKVNTPTICFVSQFLGVYFCIELFPIGKHLVVENWSIIFVAIKTYLILCRRNTYKSSASWSQDTPGSSHGDYISPRIDLIAISSTVFGAYH